MGSDGGGRWPLGVHLATVIAGVVASVFLGRLVRARRRRRQWASAGLVVVHCPAPGRYTPNISPFVVKLLTYLRLADIPYELDHTEHIGERGLTPWITLGEEHVADSQVVVEMLGRRYGKSFTEDLPPARRATARAFTVMVDEHLCWCLREWRFKVDGARNLVEGMKLPWFAWLLRVPFAFLRTRALWYQGVGRLHHHEVQGFTRADLQALSDYLGEKPYLMGQTMSEVDCSVFAQVANILHNYKRSPYYTMLNADYPNLVSYVDRVKEKLWPDWDSCLDP